MVPKDFKKPLCTTAGCVSLILAVVWGVMSVFSIGVFHCAWDFISIDINGEVTTWRMFYIAYFMGGCKSITDAKSIGFTFTPPSDPAKHLQVWMWIYTIVSIFWVPACILLIVAATSEVRGKTGAILYYPWITITAIFIVLDLAGTIYHLMDVFSTTTLDDYASFVGSTTWTALTGQNMSNDGVNSWEPSLYITLFFCRFLLFWLLNIYFVYSVYLASKAVAAYKAKYFQSTLINSEEHKTWKAKFYQGPDPKVFQDQQANITGTLSNESKDIQQEIRQRNLSKINKDIQSENIPEETMQRTSSGRYIVDRFGIPIEEINYSEPREISYNKNEGYLPRTPFESTGKVFEFTGRPLSKHETNNERWHESTPPMARGGELPTGLSKNRGFSYMAGDQPQLIGKPLSRTNSKTTSDYPVIPRPDYTIADRRSMSLEFVPNRFRVGLQSPKQPLQSSNSFTSNSPGTSSQPPVSPGVGPGVPKKPVMFPRVLKIQESEEASPMPQAKYIPQHAVPSQQQEYNTHQNTSQSSNYNNINKLY